MLSVQKRTGQCCVSGAAVHLLVHAQVTEDDIENFYTEYRGSCLLS